MGRGLRDRARDAAIQHEQEGVDARDAEAQRWLAERATGFIAKVNQYADLHQELARLLTAEEFAGIFPGADGDYAIGCTVDDITFAEDPDDAKLVAAMPCTFNAKHLWVKTWLEDEALALVRLGELLVRRCDACAGKKEVVSPRLQRPIFPEEGWHEADYAHAIAHNLGIIAYQLQSGVTSVVTEEA